MSAAAPVAPSLRASWQAGLHGARANVLPGLALQAGALALVLAYYWHPPTRDLLGHIEAWRIEVGFASSVLTTAIFGGLLPVILLWSQPATRGRYDARQAAALILFWGYKGIEVDVWYRLMAVIFGEGLDWQTITLKSLCDQFIYCPFFAIPVTVVAYETIESRFNLAAVAADLRAGSWYWRRGLGVLVSSTVIWTPAVFIIYALPTALQLPLQNLVLCFYTLLVAHLTARHG